MTRLTADDLLQIPQSQVDNHVFVLLFSSDDVMGLFSIKDGSIQTCEKIFDGDDAITDASFWYLDIDGKENLRDAFDSCLAESQDRKETREVPSGTLNQAIMDKVDEYLFVIDGSTPILEIEDIRELYPIHDMAKSYGFDAVCVIVERVETKH